MTVVYLGLGSNLGDRSRHLAEARRLLAARGAALRRASQVRETEPYGVTDQPRFLNQVLEVEWDGSPRNLLTTAKAIERELGRTPTFRWGPRVIDIDILLFGEETVREPDLIIPHPGLRRPFVRVGLQELRPDLAEPDPPLPPGRSVPIASGGRPTGRGGR
ncbi:MAG TPA: 2-amino-4-hydroxy-6-hydroxymethyldihydropteridine diphosphokinase [Candidatus Dormibacteraeota bacterium]|nr:2-amino-4-hydroxy-6-hydroxymethyldihydropteridine diphosphokinase [Candidatus Dormibacteraeota bacterium]